MSVETRVFESHCQDTAQPLAADTVVETKRKPHRKKLFRALSHVGLSVAAGTTLATAYVGFPAPIGGFKNVYTDARPALGGDTVVDLPPVGQLIFDTHDAPIKLRLRLTEIDKQTPQYLADTPLSQLKEDAKHDAKEALQQLAARAMILFTLGAGVPLLLVEKDKRKLHRVGKAGLKTLVISAAAALTLGTWGKLSYDSHAFGNPHFTGTLLSTEDIANVQNLLSNYKSNGEQIKEWIANLSSIQQGLETVPQRDNLINIIAMSGGHSSPCVYDQLAILTRGFDADLLLNAGDESEWGQSFERKAFNSDNCHGTPADLGVPMVFKNGNHDSDQISDSFEHFDNVTVLNGEVTQIPLEVDGKNVTVRIVGVPNSVFTPNPLTKPSKDEERNILENAGKRLANIIAQEEVDIAMANDASELRSMYKYLEKDSVEDQPIGVAGSRTQPKLQNHMVTTGKFGGGLRRYQTGRPVEFVFMQLDSSSKELKYLYRYELNEDGSFAMLSIPVGKEKK